MYIHLADDSDNNVRMILPPTADGEAPVVITYTVAGLNDPRAATFDGTYIHLGDFTDDNVRMILPPTADGIAPAVYTYTVSGLNDPSAAAFDGTHIHLVDSRDDNVRMILPPTANGQAPVVFTYTVDGLGNPRAATFDGTHIHLADDSDNNVRMILPPTADGIAPAVYTYTVSGLGNPRAAAFDGTHIHLADRDDNNVRMILPPTANGQAPVVFTYTVDGLGNPLGMTFDGVASATITLSTTDTDIQPNEVVDIDITSDIDISGLTASDCTVTGGTIVTLTETDAQNYVLSVTAGAAGTLNVAIGEDAVSPGNAAVDRDFTINPEPLELTWTVPTEDVGNTFSVTLNSNYALTGVELADFRLIQREPTNFINLTTTETEIDAVTLTAVVGTNNYQIDFTLNGTYDNPFEIRLINNRALHDGETVPSAGNLSSELFTVDSSLDTTTPDAPTGLSASAVTASASVATADIDLAWTAPTDDGGAAITEYQYRYSEGTSVETSAVWTDTDSTSTSFTVTGLSKNTQYTFEVRAMNSEGSGTASGTDSATTDSTEPNAPTALSATADTVTASVNTASVSLAWTAPTDTGGADITEYQYRYIEGTTAGGTWTDTNATDTTYEVTGLDKGTQYAFQVRAVNAEGQSAASNTDTATTGTSVANAPTSVTVTPNTGSLADSVSVSFTAPSDGGESITGYEVRYRVGTTIPANAAWGTSGTSTTFTITNLEKGTEYAYQIRAINSVGNGVATAVSTFTTNTTVPDAPTSLTSTVGTTSAALSWTAPTDTGGLSITDYEVSVDSGAWVSTGSTSDSATVTGLMAGTEYTFEVRAVNADGDSEASAVHTATTASLTTPAAPTGLSASADTATVSSATASVSLAWTAPTDTGGADITEYQYRYSEGTTVSNSATWTDTDSTSTSFTVTGLAKVDTIRL